ncbi:hypothetical protein [Bradyrhizobium zhanjiangense]|nr:hypothetical protein [Bradyrhizobium zhanjiangense]
MHYEAGRRIMPDDLPNIRGLLHSHMHSDDVPVRRWSLKAIALIGHADDTYRVVERMKIERDRKARSWGVAGLVRQAQDKGLDIVCKEAGLERDAPMVLASRLYAPSTWISNHSKPIAISLNDDDLTLEWATFLIGYNKAPEHLFHPRYTNEVFLGELNNHSSDEITEYSIWALWERDEFNFNHLKIAPQDFRRRPDNVRKWLYRVMTQSPEVSGLSTDLLHEFRLDKSVTAREGLALGITAETCGPEFNIPIAEWYTNEADPGVRAILLSGMAKRGGDAILAEIVTSEFEAKPPGSLERQRLLAAAEGSPLFGQLKAIQIELERSSLYSQGLLEFGDRPMIVFNHGSMTVNKGNSLSIGGNVQAQNIVAGDMISSANAAVQNMTAQQAADREVLSAILQFVEKATISQEQRQAISSAVVAAAQQPNPENKGRLLSVLKGLVGGAATVATIGGGYAEIIELVAKWVG